MRTLRWSCLICVALSYVSVRGVEPAPEKNVPFWEIPKADVDLR
jgi:hypothetical protein